MNTSSNDPVDRQMALYRNVFAGIALLLSLVFAMQVVVSVITILYGDGTTPALAAAPAAPITPPPDEASILVRIARRVNEASLGSSLARGVLMVVFFTVSTVLLRMADQKPVDWMARVASWFYVFWAAVMLGAGVYVFDQYEYTLFAYAGTILATVVFALFSVILISMRTSSADLRSFGALFVIVLLAHLLLLAVSRIFGPDLYSLGRLLIFGVITLILLGFAYAAQLIKAAGGRV